jgi:choline dehydrogenase-like flavoprotein
MMRVAVVGSGPSGVAAAATLIEDGHAVDVLDVGHTREPASHELAARVRSRVGRGERPGPELYRALRATRGGVWHALRTGLRTLLGSVEATRVQKRILGSTFVWDGADASVPLESGPVMRSLARGGLSNAWGAACYPWRPSDFAGWPITAADLEPHYARAADWLGIDQPKDALARAYPLLGGHAPDEARNLGSTAEALLARWREHEAELAAAGLTPGRTRLAVRLRGPGEEAACVRCGLCFYGCAFDVIWHSGQMLAALEREPALRYRPGHLVLGFAEDASGVRVHGRADGAAFEERYDALVLAAGVLSSLRITADSLGLHDRATPLLDNELFLVPLLALGSGPAAGFRTRFALGETVLAVEPGVVSPRPLHVQLYTCHEFFLAELGEVLRALPGFLQAAAWTVLNRLVMGFVYLPGEDSSEATARVLATAGGGPGRVRIDAHPRAESRAILRALLAHFSRLRRTLGLWPIPGFVKATPFGFGGHLSGALPMRTSPGPLETDLEGRLSGTRRTFVVDSSVFPSLPAQNLTFTVMANARRVAARLAQGAP